MGRSHRQRFVLEKSMITKRVTAILKPVLLGLAFFLATFRAITLIGIRGINCQSVWLAIMPPCTQYNLTLELVLWGLTMVILMTILFLEHDFFNFLQTLKRNWFLLLFIGLAFLSIGWTISFEITIYKSLALLSVSILAVYIGHSFRLPQIIRILTMYYALLVTLNLIYVILLPSFGIMQDPFYKGAWQGIFWHRNYMGCFMALGAVLFLVNFLDRNKSGDPDFYLNLIMLALITFLLVKSKSATALITLLVLITLVCLAYIWIRWRQQLKPVHYYGFFSLLTIVMVVFFSKLDYFLGLLGRNSSLTGRIPLWTTIYENLISLRLWQGYGYGAIWHLQGIRDGLAALVGWTNPVVIGDNGFIDIFLHLGIAGLALLTLMILICFFRDVTYFLKHRSIESAFPLLVLVFATVANISLSLILESEYFVWMVALSLLVSITKWEAHSIVQDGAKGSTSGRAVSGRTAE
jgi:exopolysaccharide production protein ExoQ